MVDVARVNMFGQPVGTFRWDERYQVALFEYDRSFVGRGLEPSPLMMPVREGRVAFPHRNRSGDEPRPSPSLSRRLRARHPGG